MVQTERKKQFPLSLVLLAGGSSRRMKQDKALMPVKQATLIEFILQQTKGHFQETLISVSNPSKFQFLQQRIIVDEEPGFGPMMGIKTALVNASTNKIFAMACDIPVIDFEFLSRLIEKGKTSEIAVSLTKAGQIEPLFAVYSKSTVPRISLLLDSGVRSVLPLLDVCQTVTVRMKSDSWFKNLNTMKDYKAFLSRLE